MSADMLIAHAEIWLVEMDHILDYPRPTLPNVKLIGGTATGPSKTVTGKKSIYSLKPILYEIWLVEMDSI